MEDEYWKFTDDILTDGLWNWNIVTQQVFYSRQWKEMLGFTDSEIGESAEEWLSRIHPEDHPKTMALLENHISGVKESFTSELRMRCKDGSYKWILSQGRIVSRDSDGKPIRMAGIQRDITKLKNTEFNLQERVKELNCHNRISQIMSNSDLGVDEVLEMIVQIIPDSWQFPQIAQAAVTVYQKIYKTTAFESGTMALVQEIKANERLIGKVEVIYPENSQFSSVPVFLPEESVLLFSIAVRIGNFIEKSEKNFALQKSEERYRNIIENINEVIFEVDCQGIVNFISSPVEKIFGYSAEEIQGKNFNLFVGENGQFLFKRLNELSEKIELKNEYQIHKKTGDSRWIQMSTRAIFSGDTFKGATGTIIDVTQRKLTELELQKSESLYRSVLNASPDSVTITSLDGIILYSSPRTLEMFSYQDVNEIINKSLFDFIDKNDHEKAKANIEKLFEGTLLNAEEYRGIRSDGSLFFIEVNSEFIRDGEGNRTSMLFVTRDISDRKQTEEELRKAKEKAEESEIYFRSVFENSPNGLSITGLDGSIKSNIAFSEMLGYSYDEFQTKTWMQITHPDDIQESSLVIETLLEGKKKSMQIEKRYLHKNGSIVHANLTMTLQKSDLDKPLFLIASVVDITNQKKAEEKIEKLNRLYSVISHVSQAIVHIRNKSELMNEVCRIAIEFGKFRMAWIGFIDEETKIVKPVAKDGFEEGYLSIINQISVNDIPQGRGPTGTAIRNGDYYVCNDIETDSLIAPWRGEALDRGYRSSIALPLKQSGKIIGSFSLYSSQPQFFDQEEVRLLDEFVNEISFAFEAIENELERQKAEKQLRKLYLAVEQSPVSIVIADLEGNIEYANPKASTTTGYDFNELIGKNPRVLKSGETPDTEYQKLWEDITSGKEWHGMFHNKRKNGEYYWESSTISPIIDSQGTITHFLAIKEDITEQKLAEQEILKFRTIAEQANYGSAIASLDGNILYINKTFARMHGYEPAELSGKSLTIFHNQEQLPLVIELIDQLKITGSFSTQEVWHTRRDGSVFPTLMNALIINDGNNVPQFLSATAIDISELKLKEVELLRSENELNKAQEIARMGSWEHNLITGELLGSKNYHRMLGLQYDAGVNLYDHFLSIVHPDDRRIIDFLQNHQYSENEMQNFEIRIQVPGEEIRWLQNNILPVLENGRLVALRGVNIDITEKKKILEDLIKAKDQAEESDKLKTSFLNNISHEIRTPFNAILGFLSMFQYDDLTPEERNEYTEIINQSAERLMDTINNIVEISQIQAGQANLDLYPLNIKNIVLELESRYRREIELKGIDFNITMDPDQSGSELFTDPHKLATILSHLLRNAVKFTNSGRIDFTIQTNGVFREFCVKDTGPGIAKNKQQFIFEHFRQADNSNTRQFEGAGLGLTIAKAYAEMLNGKIWVESVEGEGSSFYLSIPPYEKPLANGLAQSIQPEKKAEPMSRKLKILIAEDDEGSAIFISIVVKSYGNEIIKVRTGTEAVAACLTNPDIDLILMDIQMPEMDGYEATRQIREFNSDVVIFAQTAFALTGDDEKTRIAGCNEYLTKPIRKEQLLNLIQNYFQEKN